jgi:exonuclease III
MEVEMPEFVLMTYNIEWMNRMFSNGQIKDSKKAQAESVATVIERIQPHILGICEAANETAEHEHFIQEYLNGDYSVCMGASRGGQNLVFYYRDPVDVVSVDDEISYYSPWTVDIDEDGLDERHKWERKPLEVVFGLGQGGPQLRAILVHTKSKIVSSVVDLHNFEKISLANRKKLVAQATHLRARLDALLAEQNAQPVVVMGDMNDGPGMDPFERMLGNSFVETVMGSVFAPARVFHNVLTWMIADNKKDLWTTDFSDPIVSAPFGQKHRVWLDHILVSPDMLLADRSVTVVVDSGRVGEKDNAAKKASDHFPVHCKIQID